MPLLVLVVQSDLIYAAMKDLFAGLGARRKTACFRRDGVPNTKD